MMGQPEMTAAEPLFRLRGFEKRFGAVQALAGSTSTSRPDR